MEKDIKKINELRQELTKAKNKSTNESAAEVKKIEEKLNQAGCGSKRVCD